MYSCIHLLQVDSSQMINLVCHNLMEEDYSKTMWWVKICQRNAPKSYIKILLTKIDQVNKKERRAKTEAFVKGFSKLIDKEILLTEEHLNDCSDSNKELYRQHIDNYCRLKENIETSEESNPLRLQEISCKYHYEASIEAVIDCLMSQNLFGKHSMLRPIDKDLYTKIGKLGVRRRMIEKKATRSDAGPKEDKIKKGHTEIENQDVQPQTKIENTQQTTMWMQLKFLKFSEVLIEFKDIYRNYHQDLPQVTENVLQKELKNSLANLRENGLLRYFIRDRELGDDDAIFHDLSTLVNILICVFHHNLDSFLTFDPYDDLCWVVSKQESIFNEHRNMLKDKGILTMKLLRFILKKSKCNIEAEVVSNMLHCVSIAFIFNSETDGKEKTISSACQDPVPLPQNMESQKQQISSYQKENQKLFIPYFLKSVPPSLDLEDTIKDVSKFQENILSLKTQLKYNIPLPFFNELQLNICKKVPKLIPLENYIKAWRHGIFVQFGEHYGKLLMYYNDDKSVTIFLQADISKVKGHKFLFGYVAFIDRNIFHIRDSEYPGLPIDYIFYCTHCVIEHKEGGYIAEYNVKKKLDPDAQPEQIICSSDIPHGLITPLPGEFLSRLLRFPKKIAINLLNMCACVIFI